jgi:hypothetical protein
METYRYTASRLNELAAEINTHPQAAAILRALASGEVIEIEEEPTTDSQPTE